MASGVAFKHPLLSSVYGEYVIIRDVLAGELIVKSRGTAYLPNPSGDDLRGRQAKARYDAYIKRAVFYNVARNTLKGLVGTVFASDPVSNLTPEFDGFVKDTTGTGISLKQLAKQLLRYNLAYSRAGVFVDYPTTENGASREDIDTGKARPTMYAYSPLEIFNWRVSENGAKDQLSLVVLLETYGFNDDGFEIKLAAQFRVLKLVNGVYSQTIYKEETPTVFDGTIKNNSNFKATVNITPTDANGKTLDHIPFYFMGSENNDINPDNPLFYDLCSLNLAHYRNSADYEESCFVHGQPTPVITGLTEAWYNDVLKGEIKVGARGGIPLPVEADFKYVQAAPNTMIKEALEIKENQMASLGAKIIEKKTVQRTATETGIDRQRETSILQDCTENVTAAINNALADVVLFQNYSLKTPEYKLNTDYDTDSLDPDTLAKLVAMWQKEVITWDEVRSQLRRAKVATEDDEKAKAEIASDRAQAMALMEPTQIPGSLPIPVGN